MPFAPGPSSRIRIFDVIQYSITRLPGTRDMRPRRVSRETSGTAIELFHVKPESACFT